MPPLCRETSVSRTANVGTVGMNGLKEMTDIPAALDGAVTSSIYRYPCILARKNLGLDPWGISFLVMMIISSCDDDKY